MKKVIATFTLIGMVCASALFAEAHGKQKICKISQAGLYKKETIVPAGQRVISLTTDGKDTIYYAVEEDKESKEQKICDYMPDMFFKELAIPAGWHVLYVAYRNDHIIYVIEKD